MSSFAESTSVSLPVAVDVMGGDSGPEVLVAGALVAVRNFSIPVILVGDENQIRPALEKEGVHLDDPLVKVHHTTEVFGMSDIPSRAIRSKPKASMRIAYELVRDRQACAVVSTGNTGLMMAVGLFISGVLPGIARPAIATLIPKGGDSSPTVLLDSGANVDCNAEQLVQFALMGDVYAQAAIAREKPRIGLLSNGSESSKGSDITRAAAATLTELGSVNFIGYVEGRDIPRDVVDVVVCDGFVGNIVLKAMEGSVELVLDSMRYLADQSLRAKLGMWLAKPTFKKLFKEKLDPSAYGGAPLLGLNDVAIVCHGSSNSRAIMNAVRVAKKLDDENIIEHLSGALDLLDPAGTGGYENGMWKRLAHRFDKKKTVAVKPVAEKGALIELAPDQEKISEKIEGEKKNE